MKTLFPLFGMLLVVLLSVGCNKDDDDDGGSGGTGGANDDLSVVLTWDLAGVDLDLTLVDPGFGVVGLGSSVNSNGVSSGDDLDGPGEERVTFDDNAPDGNYIVTVDILNTGIEVPFTLRIESRDDGRTINETIMDDDVGNSDEFTITFVKSGRNITF